MIRLQYPKFWQKRGMMAYLLLPVSAVFLLASFVRGVLIKSHKFNKKLICVGNATIGGAGKTQLVAEIALFLRAQDVRFVIYTKAYGGSLSGAKIVEESDSARVVGDESLLLTKYGPVLAAKKFKYAKPILEHYDAEVIITDDGMQSPYFSKDVVFSVIDGYRGYGNGFLFPSGPLRMQWAKAEKISDLMLLIGKKIDEALLPNDYARNSKIIRAHTVISKIINLQNKELPLKDKRVVAFAGIGNPNKFFITLRERGINCIEEISFPDHYNYAEKDVDFISKKCAEHEVIAITTEKDIVKLQEIGNLPNIYYAKVSLDISSRDKFESVIMELLKNKSNKK